MNIPTYDEITLKAQALWRERGCPDGRDAEIWLEAERQLTEALRPDGGNPKSGSFAERAQAETAAESVVEYQISPAVSEQEAIRAAMPKKDFRAAKVKPPKNSKLNR